MAEIINLRRARKAQSRKEKAATAAANRAAHGQTKTEKRQIAAEAERVKRRLDEHRLEAGDGAPGQDED